MRVVFIGSNPSQRSQSIVPFYHDTKSMTTIVGWLNQLDSLGCKLDSHHFLNVSNSPTPSNRPLKTSEIYAELIGLEGRISSLMPDRVIALGRTAEKALTLLRIPHYAMPHPSGLNRKLNDPAYVEEKINGLREYLKCQTATNVIDP